jgi:hypothetical protein
MHKSIEALKKPAMSWLRAAAASLAALYMSGVTDPKILANAAIAGFIGPVLKALDVPAIAGKAKK